MVSQPEVQEKEPSTPLEQMLFEIKKVIVGQEALLERMVVALLARGHILVEGVPGLAKTLAIRTTAQVVGGQFNRIQFTPDLVPADLVGTRIYNQRTGEFTTSLGPVFTNLLLADEINRAPAKVQSALLEVMQERQVTIGRETHAVPNPFLVLATQNPIETEGTCAARAQVDVSCSRCSWLPDRPRRDGYRAAYDRRVAAAAPDHHHGRPSADAEAG
jgi:MoxR-like ATPase